MNSAISCIFSSLYNPRETRLPEASDAQKHNLVTEREESERLSGEVVDGGGE